VPSETASKIGQAVSHAVSKAKDGIKKRGTKGTIKHFFKKAWKKVKHGAKEWGPQLASMALPLLLAPNPGAPREHHVEVRKDLICLMTSVLTQLEYVVGCPQMA